MHDYGTLGKYRLLQPLAQGGMAEIFLAKHEGPAGFSKTVVIKRVLPHFSKNSEFVQMFLDEARLAARLEHPNIVRISDFGEVGEVYFLCMEHLVGEDLAALLREAIKRGQPLPATIASSIVAAACDGLHYAHTLTNDEGKPLRIVHRDISPANVFITYHGAVKVLDFGIAKAEGKVVQTRAGILKGKLQYMSPEQIGNKTVDARSDVFALGVVLYELVTGARPFQRDEEVATIMAILQEPIAPPSQLQPDMPGELDDIILRALERDPGQRFQSANELRRALEAFLSSRTTAPVASQLQEFMLAQVGEERIRLRSAPPSAPSRSRPPPAPVDSSGILPLSEVGEAAAPPTVGSALTKVALPTSASLAPRAGERLVKLGVGGAVLAMVAFCLALYGFRLGPFADPIRPEPARRLWAPSADSVVTSARKAAAPTAPVPGAPLPDVAAAAPPAPAPAPRALPGITPPATAPAPKAPPDVAAAAALAPVAAPVARPPIDDRPAPRAAPTPGPKVVAKPLPATPPTARPAAEPGLLDVNCVPWCRVYINEMEGLDAPVQGMKLAPGLYRVRVVIPSGQEREHEVTVESSKTAKKLIRF